MATKKASKKIAKKQTKATKKANSVKKAGPKKTAKKSAKAAVKPVAKKQLARPKAAAKGKVAKHRPRGKADFVDVVSYENTGLGARTGGQSGDTQGLSGIAATDSESVKELLEEGQSFEAEVLEGVENVPDADEGEVRTHEVPEDDVPGEYLGKD